MAILKLLQFVFAPLIFLSQSLWPALASNVLLLLGGSCVYKVYAKKVLKGSMWESGVFPVSNECGFNEKSYLLRDFLASS